MIRINLLPVRAARRAEQGKVQLALGIMAVAAVIAGNWWWASSTADKLEAVQRDIANIEREIAQLEKIIGEVKDIQKRKDELQKKLDVIEKLRKQKTGPVKVLDSLASIIPKEVWVDDIVEKDGNLTMNGEAMSHEDLALFITQLKASPFFKNIELKTAKLGKAPAGDSTVVEFTLTGKADYAAG